MTSHIKFCEWHAHLFLFGLSFQHLSFWIGTSFFAQIFLLLVAVSYRFCALHVQPVQYLLLLTSKQTINRSKDNDLSSKKP